VELHDCLKLQPFKTVVILTNYKIVILAMTQPEHIRSYLTITFGQVSRIEECISNSKQTDEITQAELHTKDFRYLKLTFDSHEECNEFIKIVREHSFSHGKLDHKFATLYRIPRDLKPLGWKVYEDPIKEFERQGATM